MKEERKLTSDGRLVTKQEYIDDIKSEMIRIKNLTDEELDAELVKDMEEEPEGPIKELMKEFFEKIK